MSTIRNLVDWCHILSLVAYIQKLVFSVIIKNEKKLKNNSKSDDQKELNCLPPVLLLRHPVISLVSRKCAVRIRRCCWRWWQCVINVVPPVSHHLRPARGIQLRPRIRTGDSWQGRWPVRRPAVNSRPLHKKTIAASDLLTGHGRHSCHSHVP